MNRSRAEESKRRDAGANAGKGIESMATTTTEVRAGEFTVRQRATSRVAAGLRSHRTLMRRPLCSHDHCSPCYFRQGFDGSAIAISRDQIYENHKLYSYG